MGMSAQEKLVRDYLDAVCRGDHDAVRGYFAADATWNTAPSMPWPARFEGVEEIIEGYFAVDKGLFKSGYSSYDLRIKHVHAAGDSVVVEMQHYSEGLNDNVYDTEHCVVFEIVHGKIQAVREYIDSLYLQQQMMD